MGTPKKHDTRKIDRDVEDDDDDEAIDAPKKKIEEDDEDDFDGPLDDDLGFETYSDEDDEDY